MNLYDSISKKGHILRHWELEPQRLVFLELNSTHNTKPYPSASTLWVPLDQALSNLAKSCLTLTVLFPCQEATPTHLFDLHLPFRSEIHRQPVYLLMRVLDLFTDIPGLLGTWAVCTSHLDSSQAWLMTCFSQRAIRQSDMSLPIGSFKSW